MANSNEAQSAVIKPTIIHSAELINPANRHCERWLVEPLPNLQDVKMPTQGTDKSAGYDIYAFEGGIIPAHGQAMFRTGLRFAFPRNFGAQVRSRSGLKAKHNIEAFHGTIDNDYRDELKIIMTNHSDNPYEVKRFDRIAQLVLQKQYSIKLEFVKSGDIEQLVSKTNRFGGFGSTGTNHEDLPKK